MPTAFAPKQGHPHIGLPLSQALVRRVDRDKLRSMFADHGLPAHGVMAPADMEATIDEWMAEQPCPASRTLERAWRGNAGGRERIAQLACLELESWDGAEQAHAQRAPVARVRLRSVLRSFPSTLLELSPAVTATSRADATTAAVLGDADEVIGTLDLIPLAPGWYGPSDPAALDAESFLGGTTRIRLDTTGAVLDRQPRRLVPLRHDELLQAHVETERLLLGEDCQILVVGALARKVEDLLGRCARPGFARADSLDGLPRGWTLFTRVQVLSNIPREVLRTLPIELNLLQPSSTRQVTLQGGMVLPGNLRKWSAMAPPELVVTHDDAHRIDATLRCTRPLASPTPQDRARHSTGGTLIWDLAEERLPDGDYEVSLTIDGKPSPGQTLVRLRSADHPAVRIGNTQPLAREIDDPLRVLSARPAAGAATFEVAPRTPAPIPEQHEAALMTPAWVQARKGHCQPSPPLSRQITVPSPSDSSCMVTGAHVIQLPTAGPGAQPKTVEGVCKHCGLTKRYPGRWSGHMARRRVQGTEGPASPVDLSDVAPVRREVSVDWTRCFDAVCHVLGGRPSHLARVATQVTTTDLRGDSLLRLLEVLGHVEVERDRTTLVPVYWEVVSPTLAGLPSGDWQLVGFRSEGLLTAIDDFAHANGATLRVDGQIEGPPVVRLAGLDEEGVRALAGVIAQGARACRVVPNAAAALLAVLPPLSTVVDALPTGTVTTARSIELWDTLTCRFGPATDASRVGAYRLQQHGRLNIYRRRADIERGVSRFGDARLVKHAAALDAGQSMIGYDPQCRVLYVPLGADLPGLYGRAAVLCSGRPPVPQRNAGLLQYHEIPPWFAARVAQLLAS